MLAWGVIFVAMAWIYDSNGVVVWEKVIDFRNFSVI